MCRAGLSLEAPGPLLALPVMPSDPSMESLSCYQCPLSPLGKDDPSRPS